MPHPPLILYHGVLAPRAAWRRAVVPAREDAHERQVCDSCAGETDGTPSQRLPNPTWAELMQRNFGFDVLACPRCAGRLRLVALIQDGAVIQRILRHLGLPDVVPEMRPDNLVSTQVLLPIPTEVTPAPTLRSPISQSLE